jgi:hypothetical protein
MFRNIENGAHIITKEMADYSAMKSYLEKSKLHYIISPPQKKKFEKPTKAVIHHLRPGTPAEQP